METVIMVNLATTNLTDMVSLLIKIRVAQLAFGKMVERKECSLKKIQREKYRKSRGKWVRGQNYNNKLIKRINKKGTNLVMIPRQLALLATVLDCRYSS
jgi:hypothetical protein